MATNTQILSAAGSTLPIAMNLNSIDPRRFLLAPSVMVFLSPGASLTYTVQVTGDSLTSSAYVPANGNWNSFDGMASLTASANGTLTGLVTGLRCTITSYTSGTLTFQVVQ